MAEPRARERKPAEASFLGVDSFIRGVSELARLAYHGDTSASQFVRTLGDCYAFIRLNDLPRPLQFLGQMAGAPPIRLGIEGFREDIVDDFNPARHYTALLFVGFHTPAWLATLVLYMWEIAGFIRYRGEWSWPDIRSGQLGIEHGRLVRRYGPVILPGLIAAQLAESSGNPSSGGASSGSASETLRAS